MLNPIFEYYANQLLTKIGIIIYAQTSTTRSKFSHIRGCVLYNLNEDLIDYIGVQIPGVGEFKVDVIYRTLPNACFTCKGWGHIAHHCPNKQKNAGAGKGVEKGDAMGQQNYNANKGKKQVDQDGFEAVNP